MRCALGIVTALVAAIGVAGCGSEAAPTSDGHGAGLMARPDAAGRLNRGDVARSATPVDDSRSIPVERDPRARSRESETAEAVEPEPASRRHAGTTDSQFQAGTLTAGSIDDHADYDEFRSYLSRTLQQARGGGFPSLDVGRRVVVRVTNEQGLGIGDARLTIRPLSVDADNQPDSSVAFSTTTAGDGRALFLPSRDLAADGSEYLLTIHPPGGGQPIERRVFDADENWTVVLPDARQNLPARLDLALVIDTTGSMKDELDYLKVEIDDIAAAVKRRFPNVEQRFALVLYRDEGDEYVTRTFDFTGSLAEFRSTLARQSANGGGDFPEAMHVALEQAGRLDWRGSQTARVLFLVGDAPPHARFAERTMAAVESLRGARVKLFPVAASGVKDKAEWMMRSAAFLTMGRYLFLTDHSGVGNPHAKPQAPRYVVEKLNALMIRTIASELAGRELQPHEVIATEAGITTPTQPQRGQSAATLPAARYRVPLTSRRREASFTESIGPWCRFCIESTAFRLFLAALAIGLIWKLDNRRREAVR